MFATILGGLPRPPLPAGASIDDLVEAAVRAQEEAGLEPITDGRLRWRSAEDPLSDGVGPRPVLAWQALSKLTASATKAALLGPYSASWRLGLDAIERHAFTRKSVRGLKAEVRRLAEAGCPLVEIVEDEAHRIGDDPAERAVYRDAHTALTDGVTGTHLSLAIVGGNADAAGIETILAPAYASLAVDLIDGPDNWRLVARAPANLGIVAGAMASRPDGSEGPELILYAARYAASTQARGPARVGVALVPGLDQLPWDIAVRKMNALGHAARVAALPPGDELADAVDPRSIDIRTAALGRRRKR